MIAWLGDLAGAWFWWIAIVSLLLAIAAESAAPDRSSHFPARRWTDHIALYAACLVLAGVLDPRPYVSGLFPEQPTTVFGWVDRVGGQTTVLVTGLLLLDLFVYFMHWLQHVVFGLWRFHAVHHSDRELDASTSMRHHPFAYLQVAVCVTIAFGLLGLPPWVFPVYAIVLFLAALFQHWNVSIPARLQRRLGWVLVCPNMHRLHHSTDPEHFNCNFGNVLSVWDRLFGTLRVPAAPEEARLVFGLDTIPDQKSWFWTWKMPFSIARPANRGTAQYWRGS